MQTPRRYGTTDLFINPLGLGAAQIGDATLDDAQVGRLLNTAVDGGQHRRACQPLRPQRLGLAEERIGRHLATRRRELILSTKLGYGVSGIPDWTGPCITAGVEQALRLLRTDYLDIAHFHSCPRAVLEQSDVIDALEAAKQAGKVRAIAYSGENTDLAWAVACGRFDGFMASLNLCDQRIASAALPAMAGRGFIAKRAVANHPWRFAQRPVGDYCERLTGCPNCAVPSRAMTRNGWVRSDTDHQSWPRLPSRPLISFSSALRWHSTQLVKSRMPSFTCSRRTLACVCSWQT